MSAIERHGVTLDCGAGAGPTPDAGRREPAASARRVRSPSLDAVRVALSLAVLAYHLSGTIALPKYFDVRAFATLFSVGDARIPFFFVLSGFLLTLLHGADPVGAASAGRFLWKRAIRIYPAYWIVLGATALAAAALPGYAELVPGPLVMLKAALLVPQPHEVAGPTGAPLIVAAWTLHYELAFYAVVAACIASRALGALVVALLLANLLACTEQSCGFYRDFLASQYALHFAIGAGAAWLARHLAPSRRASAVACAGIAVYAALVALEYTAPGGGEREAWSLAYAAVAGTILLALRRAESSGPVAPPPRWLATLSQSSYALYLVHFPLISAGCKLATAAGLRGAAGATLAFGAIAVACIGAAIAFHRYVEAPLVRRLGGGA